MVVFVAEPAQFLNTRAARITAPAMATAWLMALVSATIAPAGLIAPRYAIHLLVFASAWLLVAVYA